MQIRRVTTSMMFATEMVKHWKKKFWKYWISVHQAWHKKCTSLKKPNDTCGAVTIETIHLAPVSFCQKPNILERGTKGPAWNRHGSHIVLTLIIRLAGVDSPWTKRLGIFILIKRGPAAKLLSWRQRNKCHLVSFVTNISGAKFEEHCIYGDILFSVLGHCSCKPHDGHHFPNLINKRTSISQHLYQLRECLPFNSVSRV